MKKIVFAFALFSILSLSAKEYRSLEAYKIATGKSSVSKFDWLTKDRLTNSFQWQKACRFNFSYEGGYKQYEQLEERDAFMMWLSNMLEKEGYGIAYASTTHALLHLFDEMGKKFPFGGVKDFVDKIEKPAFEFAFKRLQELWSNREILEGEEAQAFDKAMFTEEHTQIYQAVINSMSIDELGKLNKILDRKGWKAKRIVDKSITHPGNFQELKQRLYWVENRVAPYSKK